MAPSTKRIDEIKRRRPLRLARAIICLLTLALCVLFLPRQSSANSFGVIAPLIGTEQHAIWRNDGELKIVALSSSPMAQINF
jgi:hypothetical protein